MARSARARPIGVARIEPGDPLRIFEVRASPYAVGREGWTEDELSIAVAIRRVTVRAQPSVDDIAAIVAVVGLHALARRFERGVDGSDEAVLRDLLVLTDRARWRSGIRNSTSEFDVPASGEVWRGGAVRLDGQPALAVRTFVA